MDRAAHPRLTDHPFATMRQPVVVRNPAAHALPSAYIRCTARPPGTMHAQVTAAALCHPRAAGWATFPIAADHDTEQSRPDAVAAILRELA